MDAERDYWKTFFLNWPAKLARRGLAVAGYDEQIPFVAFLTHDDFVLLQRMAPDAMGARVVILPYDQIVAVKLTEVVKQQVLSDAGFEGKLSKQ